MAGHFDINKTRKFVGQKDYWSRFQKDMETNVKSCNICLVLKAIRHKPYSNFQLLSIPTHQWKNFSINFVTKLPISIDWKGENYDFILVIMNYLTKMMHYKPVKVIINIQKFAKVILDMVLEYHKLPNLIVANKNLLFISKFWSLLCYFLRVKW